jgi:hypothetical protein
MVLHGNTCSGPWNPPVKVISYIGTLPTKLLSISHADNAKVQTLTKFAQGVTAVGDDGMIITDMDYQDCDVAVMLGWVHEHGKSAPHLRFRQHILDQQRQRGRRVVIADSNLFLYADPNNPHYYLRYSFDGIFPNTGEYCDQQPDPGRWTAIQQEIGVNLRPWRLQGNHILMCLQRDGGWSMAGFDVVDWALITAKQIRQYSDRPIRIRSHPGDKKAGRYCRNILDLFARHGLRNVSLSNHDVTLSRDFKHCWAMVCHNSSPAVAAAIEGIPVFVTDPTRSQACAVANIDLSQIEMPNTPDREQWIHRISQFHWSFADLTSGRCWQHMRQWAQT